MPEHIPPEVEKRRQRIAFIWRFRRDLARKWFTFPPEQREHLLNTLELPAPQPEINADIDERIRRGAGAGAVTFSSLNHLTAAPVHTPPSKPPKTGLLRRIFGRRTGR